LYNGIKEITLNDENLALFYQGNYQIDMLENQYLLILGSDGEVVDKLRYDGSKFDKVKARKISSGFDADIKPLNVYQELWFDLLENDNIQCKSVYGKFGSGKTYIALCWSLGAINKNKYRKLVYIRNNVEVKDSNPIGYLPSDQNSKLKPWALPIADILGGEMALNQYLLQDKIELCHLGFIRGRTFDNCILLVSECQNLTKEHIEVLISRCGKNTVIIFDGDKRQVDKMVFEKNSGLEVLTETLKGNKLFGVVQLCTTVRSQLAGLADLFE